MKNFSNLDIMDISRALGDDLERATPHSVYSFLKDDYLKRSGGGFNYNSAIEAFRFGMQGKFDLPDAMRHARSTGAPYGQKYNCAVLKAIWPCVEANEGKAYSLKYTAVRLRRIRDKTIYFNIKSPVISVKSDRSVSIKLPSFRSTFGPNHDQKRFMMSVATQVLARDDFENASVQMVEAKAQNNSIERRLNLLNSNDIELYDIDRVEDLLTVYTSGVELLFENGFDTRSADLSRYRVVDRDQTELF